MFGLSLGHLIILLVVILLFGSRRLPELGSALGRGLHAFKKGLEGPPESNPSTPSKKPGSSSSSDSDSDPSRHA
ncbi:MAG: twin-arginine translocase TatA/TatE family subunit [Oligoflexia bacterium]